VDKAEDEPDLASAVNGAAPGIIGTAAKAVGAKVIHLSTDYVFDGTLDRPYRENDAVGPIGVYGSSKLQGETALAASGVEHAILRTAWVYSPFGHNFLKTMLNVARTRDALTVVGDQVGCPTSALDIADALYAAIAGWERRGDETVFHLAGSGETSWAGFAREIFARSRELDGPTADVTDIATADWPTRATRPANSRLNSAKFAETFGHVMPAWQQSTAAVVERVLAASV
jgi:dTDP-4-dehydrorhamnose reductase